MESCEEEIGEVGRISLRRGVTKGPILLSDGTRIVSNLSFQNTKILLRVYKRKVQTRRREESILLIV